MDIGRLTVRLPPGANAMRTGIWLLDRGLWPVVISAPDDPRAASPGKSPVGKEWGRRKPTVQKLRAMYRWNPGAGIGLLLGPRGEVVDVEIDDPDGAEPELGRIFPAGIPSTLGWRSTRGEHRLFLWDVRLADLAPSSVVALAGGAVELRLGGGDRQVASVCPPSLGTDGIARAWNGVRKIAPFPEELLAELERIKAARGSRPLSPVPRPTRGSDRGSRYVQSALAREIEVVRVAGPGMRNRTLNRAAFNLGQLVGSGSLGREEVEAALRDAGLACGLHEREVEATLQSGLDAGLKSPRTPPAEDDGHRS